MRKQIKHIAVTQCGKTLGAFCYLFSLPFVIFLLPGAIALEASVGLLASLALLILVPVLYGAAAFLHGWPLRRL